MAILNVLLSVFLVFAVLVFLGFFFAWRAERKLEEERRKEQVCSCGKDPDECCKGKDEDCGCGNSGGKDEQG